jgi:hypothetical protein
MRTASATQPTLQDGEQRPTRVQLHVKVLPVATELLLLLAATLLVAALPPSPPLLLLLSDVCMH